MTQKDADILRFVLAITPLHSALDYKKRHKSQTQLILGDQPYNQMDRCLPQ